MFHKENREEIDSTQESTVLSVSNVNKATIPKNKTQFGLPVLVQDERTEAGKGVQQWSSTNLAACSFRLIWLVLNVFFFPQKCECFPKNHQRAELCDVLKLIIAKPAHLPAYYQN